jgi:hypothetical protein
MQIFCNICGKTCNENHPRINTLEISFSTMTVLLYMPLCAGICHPAPSTLPRSSTETFLSYVVTEGMRFHDKNIIQELLWATLAEF